jgi:hypothetical protein
MTACRPCVEDWLRRSHGYLTTVTAAVNGITE